MANHPATTVKNKFSDYNHEYYANGKLSLPFAEMIDQAQRLVEISDLTTTPVPRKRVTIQTPPATAASDTDDILALLAARVDSQQDTLKSMFGLLSSMDNQQKQFKANFAKQKPPYGGDNPPSGSGNNRQMPPFMEKAPTDPDEVKIWNDKPWYYCKNCKQGNGSWSPSHSTNGIPALSVPPHRGRAPTNKRYNSDACSDPKRQKTVPEPKGRSNLKVMKASFMIQGGQTMAAILAARKSAAELN
jgi:hypothetical protein